MTMSDEPGSAVSAGPSGMTWLTHAEILAVLESIRVRLAAEVNDLTFEQMDALESAQSKLQARVNCFGRRFCRV